jgi:DsbC/DsbD-like thiol-disulfide interchange protein/cytochrome c biogenesis protein CcdA/peroxiredoxin
MKRGLRVRALLSWATKGLAALALAAATFGGAAYAQASAKSDHAEGTLVFERSAATPGDSFLGALKLDLAEGWHVYWKNPGDSGLPPTAEWTPSPGVTFGDFRFPAPHAIPLATLMNYGYEQQVVLPFQIQIAADAKPGTEAPIGGKIEYLICADICIPEDIELSTTLRIAASPETDADGSAIIVGTLAHIPVALTGKASVERTSTGFRLAAADAGLAGAIGTAKNIRFFPDGPELSNPAKQIVKTGPEGVSIELTASDFAKAGDQNLNGIIVLTDGDGSTRAWEIAALPGPAPAGVADKEFINADTSGITPPPAVAAAAPLGFTDLLITLGLAFVGGLVLNLMPCVLPVLTIKAAGLVHTAHNPKESRAHGLAYLGGVVVCFAAIGGILIVLRAAGEQAGLGFQLQYPPITAFFALVMFAVGLNLLGVFEMGGSLMGVGSGLAERGGTSGAFFTGLLAAFVGAPCVGPFMAPAFATALAAACARRHGCIRRRRHRLGGTICLAELHPGLRQSPAEARQVDGDVPSGAGLPDVHHCPLAALGARRSVGPGWNYRGVSQERIALGFGIWLAEEDWPGHGRPYRCQPGHPRCVRCSVGIDNMAESRSLDRNLGANAWSPEKVAELQAEGRVIFVDFTARWCVTCQFNKTALHDASVARAFTDLNVAFLEADWTNKDKVIASEARQAWRSRRSSVSCVSSLGGCATETRPDTDAGNDRDCGAPGCWFALRKSAETLTYGRRRMAFFNRDRLPVMLGAAAAAAITAGALMVSTANAAPPGDAAPAFTEVNTAGKPISLADFKGKTVILEWTNDGCPFVQKHYNSKNMQKTQAAATADGVVLAIGDLVEARLARPRGWRRVPDKLTADRGAKPTHVLLDPDGSMGRAYGAKTTPHMYIITPDGKVAYNGAIDSIKSNKVEDVPKATNYVTAALASLKSGKAPDPALTVPYGCDVKY